MSLRGKIAARAICNLEAADEIIGIIHGDAKPVAWQYQDGWGNWHSTDFPFSPEKVQNDPHIRPLFLSPPPPTVTREQVEAIGRDLARQLNETLPSVLSLTTEKTTAFNIPTALTAAGLSVESE